VLLIEVPEFRTHLVPLDFPEKDNSL